MQVVIKGGILKNEVGPDIENDYSAGYYYDGVWYVSPTDYYSIEIEKSNGLEADRIKQRIWKQNTVIAHTAKDISEADILHWSTKSCAKVYRWKSEIHSGIKHNFETKEMKTVRIWKQNRTEALKEIKHCTWTAEDFNISDGFESHEVVDRMMPSI